MHRLRTITGMNACPERVVGVHALARRRARKKLNQRLEILPTRNYFFDADDGNQSLGQRETHAAVAFALHNADATCLCNKKVRSTDRCFHTEKLFAEEAARSV